MQEFERPGDVDDDPESPVPVQIGAFFSEKRLLQASIGHVLVDQELLPPLDAVAEERDDERRPEAGEHLELVLKLAIRRGGGRRRRGRRRGGGVEALDGDGLAVAEDAAEDGAGASAAEGVGGGEAGGGGLEVSVGEAAEAEGGCGVEGSGAGAAVEEEGVPEVEEEEEECEEEEGGGGDDEGDEQNSNL